MLFHKCVELGPSVADYGGGGSRASVNLLVGETVPMGFLGLVSAHWLVRLVPDMAGSGVSCVSELMSACLWVGTDNGVTD